MLVEEYIMVDKVFDMRKNIIDIVSEGEYNKINKIDK